MNRLTAISTVALCAGLLAACSKPAGGGAASTAGTPTTSTAPNGDVIIDVSHAPHPRAGLWEMTEQIEGMSHPLRMCVADRPFDVGKVKTFCQSFVFHKTLTGLAVDAKCAQHGFSSTMHMTVQGDLNSAYSTDAQMSMEIPGQGSHAMTMHADYKYVGPCSPAEQAEANERAAHEASNANGGGGSSGE